MEPLATFGLLDTYLAPVIEYVILALAVVNVATRHLAYHSHVSQAAESADAISRHPLHAVTNVLLVLSALYFVTLELHAGVVLSLLVVSMFLADFFEFEARKVEARTEIPLERPKSAIVASVLVLLYAAYTSVFYLVEGIWNSIV